jgi:hypothetical protein
MYDDAAEKIQEKFEATRREIEAKFNDLAEVIRGFLKIIHQFLVGLARIIYQFARSGAIILKELFYIVFSIFPLVMAIKLGFEWGNTTGVIILIFAGIILIVLSSAIIYVFFSGKPKIKKVKESSDSWRTTLLSFGLILNVIVGLLYLYYYWIFKMNRGTF